MKRILIVEDEIALLKVYSALFSTQKKFRVYEASHGKIALEKLDSVKPDVIILDILMPVMGGIEFLEAANIKEVYPNTKVLVLSNLSDPKTLAKIKKLGANKYLLKASISPSELINTVNQLLTKKAGSSV